MKEWRKGRPESEGRKSDEKDAWEESVSQEKGRAEEWRDGRLEERKGKEKAGYEESLITVK